ncbi:MAG: ATP phosphoribosyltransferase regulatory subunit [Litoreibacter sp.]
MTVTKAARRKAQAMFDVFQAQGAQEIETEVLQPAETLLDLYGETIRNRAYVTFDPIHGEMMLRPDFTVPVVQMHMRDGTDSARYTYMGEAFRKQAAASGRPREFLQVGYEVFGHQDPAEADAEVFSVIQRAIAPNGVRAVIGDIGILRAAVQGLDTSALRKAALMRHIWRPKRFAALLQRYSNPIERLPRDEICAKHIGLRSAGEIAARHTLLDKDAKQAPLPQEQLAALAAILALNAPAKDALIALQDIAVKMPSIKEAVDRYALRLAALEAQADTRHITFEGSYGRTSLEYYDGFVFGIYPCEKDGVPIASGGRYDALTRVLGQGRSILAVGGIVRPELLVALEDAV